MAADLRRVAKAITVAIPLFVVSDYVVDKYIIEKFELKVRYATIIFRYTW